MTSPMGEASPAERSHPRDPTIGSRKARDGALALPIIGGLLLMPPVGRIFAIEGSLFGMPFVFVFVFAVWFGLVIGAWRIGRRFLETETVEGGLGGRAR